MKIIPIEPPREFVVGRGEPIRIRDCGRVELAPDEQLTFLTESGAEYDLARKTWGFYATPSMNARLSGFGLRAALAKSCDGKFYVFLMERGREPEFARYLALEQNEVLCWLDSAPDLEALEGWLRGRMLRADSGLSCPCEAGCLVRVHQYVAPPDGEVRFPSLDYATYQRALYRCAACGHFLSVDAYEHDDLYAGQYVDATYGDTDGIRRNFERIVALDPSRSDNAGRVERVCRYAADHFPDGFAGRRVLDVGAGLCVFLHRMKEAGWACTALDPDERAARHATAHVGVDAVHGDFSALASGLGRFDAVTFNKVLEHVKDPVAMLRRAHECLVPGGFVYVELPDGECAWAEGPSREEFFIDHHHVFSMASMAALATRAGFVAQAIERLREPSTKYTLRAFLVPSPT